MRQRIFVLLAGMALGMALISGGSALATAVCTAMPSDQPFYIDGQRISMTAYQIGGENYVRLRDIGQAVGFNVYWDSAVRIESDKPYTGTGPVNQAPASSQQTPAVLSEESVQAALLALKAQYPHFSTFPYPYRSTSGGPYYSGMNCAGWATLCSDAIFGNLPWRRVDSPGWDQIRIGDLIEYDTEQARHVVVVVSKTSDTLGYTDSGTDQKVYWGATVPRWWVEIRSGLTLYTRYPN